MNTTVCGSSTAQFTFFVVMILNINIVTSGDLLIVILVLNFSSLKLEMDRRSTSETLLKNITHRFIKLVVIFFYFFRPRRKDSLAIIKAFDKAMLTLSDILECSFLRQKHTMKSLYESNILLCFIFLVFHLAVFCRYSFAKI